MVEKCSCGNDYCTGELMAKSYIEDIRSIPQTTSVLNTSPPKYNVTETLNVLSSKINTITSTIDSLDRRLDFICKEKIKQADQIKDVDKIDISNTTKILYILKSFENSLERVILKLNDLYERIDFEERC